MRTLLSHREIIHGLSSSTRISFFLSSKRNTPNLRKAQRTTLYYHQMSLRSTQSDMATITPRDQSDQLVLIPRTTLNEIERLQELLLNTLETDLTAEQTQGSFYAASHLLADHLENLDLRIPPPPPTKKGDKSAPKPRHQPTQPRPQPLHPLTQQLFEPGLDTNHLSFWTAFRCSMYFEDLEDDRTVTFLNLQLVLAVVLMVAIVWVRYVFFKRCEEKGSMWGAMGF